MISPVAMFFSSYAMVETYSLNGRFSSLATANPAASTSAILLQFLSATVISMDNGGHGMISSLIHPASTTHSQLTESELLEQDIHQGTIRLSIGLEHIDDLKNDLEQALNSI